MRPVLKIIALSCFAIVITISSAVVSAELIEKIVAILDGELILLSEIREQIERPVGQILANLQGASNLEEEALPYIIERKLLQQEIQYLARPKDTEFTKVLAMEYIAATYKHQSPEELQQHLAAQGISEEEVEEEILLYMKGVDYIRRKFRFNSDVDKPEVVSNLFQNWLKDLKAKAQIQMLP